VQKPEDVAARGPDAGVHLRPAPALRGDEARAACARDARSPVGAASVHDNDLRSPRTRAAASSVAPMASSSLSAG
jgi:hypothetical protein